MEQGVSTADREFDAMCILVDLAVLAHTSSDRPVEYAPAERRPIASSSAQTHRTLDVAVPDQVSGPEAVDDALGKPDRSRHDAALSVEWAHGPGHFAVRRRLREIASEITMLPLLLVRAPAPSFIVRCCLGVARRVPGDARR
jgi:hypothetical protein